MSRNTPTGEEKEDMPTKGNFLGKDVVLRRHMVYSGEGEPISPYKW